MGAFKNSDDKDIDITIDSSSLQPFTDQEWRFNQQFMINTQRKRAVTIHVSDQQGNRLQGAVITISQVSKDFPFGSAIAHTILGKLPYQAVRKDNKQQFSLLEENRELLIRANQGHTIMVMNLS
ncbi:hypothetical protein GOBAR_DD00981 [Gossypium barbadense]|nr:hypothetical protein GOBAR_DD00981 [Gossypium barbadense]